MIHESPEVSLLVRNYNGIKFLQEYMSSIVDAAEASNYRTEVIVVDDGSTDGSVLYLLKNWSNVRVIAMPNNTGHAPAANKGVAESKGEVVIALDNDVRVDKNFVDPLISHFTNPNVFAVNSKIILPRLENINESVKTVNIHHGMLYFGCVQNPPEYSVPILYATACAVAYRKSIFLNLGGFDTLYPPLYWDDTDLSYRARKRGYEVLYEPASRVEHWYGGSIDPAKKRQTERRKWENYFLFFWKNITDEHLIRSHILYLPLVLAKSAITGDINRVAGFFAALKQFKRVRQERDIEKATAIVSDTEILGRFADPPELGANFRIGTR